MKLLYRVLQLVAACAWVFSSAVVSAQLPLKLERVVLLMRHGVRPPTKLQPIPVEYGPLPWPAWPVAPGLLTPHGAMGISRLAAADRIWLVSNGIVPATGCPAHGEVAALASKTPRAIETAETWVATALPNCGIVVQHPGKDQPDLLFHILETKPAWFDGHRAYQEALAQAPGGSFDRQVELLEPDMRRMANALACNQPCPLLTEKSTLDEQVHDAPKIKGPIDYASTASESFVLEYDEGMPLSSVAWGRVSRGEIERLLIFNVTKFKYVNRPPYIAGASAGPLARIVLDTFNAHSAPKLTILGGHDTNIAPMAGVLGVHWDIPSYLTDDIPPGSALGFELVSDSFKNKFVRIFFRAQTMDELRSLATLDPAKGQPFRQYVAIPGCGRPDVGCPLLAFTRIVSSRIR